MKVRSRVALLVVALIATLTVVGAASSRGRPSCIVSNEHTALGSRSLQAAIDAAASGDVLVVKGTCVGVSTINKDLTLKGVGNPAFGEPTLDGGDVGGSVLSIGSVTVSITNLTITNGSVLATSGGNDRGGGIYNAGTVTLTHTTVSGNIGRGAAGIFNGAAGTMTLIDSTVTHNQADFGGGGISNLGTLALTRSTVSRNTSQGGGGVINGGTLTLTDSTVSNNFAGGDGGGILNAGVATLTRSTVGGNGAIEGGGIANQGTLALVESVVSGNSAPGGSGGGILNNADGMATLTDSTVSDNRATEGAGIRNDGALTLADSTVSRNSAGYDGGGIVNTGTVTFSGANTIVDNVPQNCVGVSGC